MFTGARARLTGLYVALFGLMVLVVAAAITVRAIQETRRRDDLELRLRAENLVGQLQTPDADLQLEAHEASEHLEGEGILTYLLTVLNGTVQPSPATTAGALPDLAAAQTAFNARAARFDTLDASGSDVRVYSLPVNPGGSSPAVVQVARTLYFADRSVRRLILTTLAIGGIALLAATAVAYWLAGLTIRPIVRALARQQAFAADASHELRTPLSIVLGNAELLQRHPGEPIGTYAEVVEDIVAESRRLTRLVADLLTLARSDAGQLTVSNEDVNLSEIGATLVRQFAPLAQRKDLQLVASVAPDVHVRGDAHWLQALGTILLENAVRYTATGEVSLRIAQHGKDACFEVADTGAGIAPEHLPRLKERFYRVDAMQSEEDGGAGLGLAIADWIVRAHQTELAISSTPGKGSTFTVHLHGDVEPGHAH